MKWAELAKFLIPVVAAFVPGAAPLAPLILSGVNEAEQLVSASGADKKAHVLRLVAAGAATATATGKVTIDPTTAVAVTEAVFAAVDGVHAVVNANQPK